jgi:hypothetical protein
MKRALEKHHQGMGVGRQSIAQIVVSFHQQKARPVRDGQQPVRVFDRYRAVGDAVHQQGRAAHRSQRSQGCNFVKGDANDPLDMAQDVPAQQWVWHSFLRHETVHHLGGVGECRETDHGPNVVVVGGVQQGGGCAHRVTQQRKPLRVDCRVVPQPGQA